MEAYTYSYIKFFKNQKQHVLCVILLLIFYSFIYFQCKNSLGAEFLFLFLPMIYNNLILPAYEEEFKNGMAECQILKKYNRITFFLEKNLFFLLASIVLSVLMSIVFMLIAPNVGIVIFIKLTTIVVIETLVFSMLAYFINFIIESKSMVQYVSLAIGFGWVFFLLRYGSPRDDFLKSLFFTLLATILMFIVNTIYVEKRYRLTQQRR
ncbi:MAG: hypothetical protein LBI41_02460 [Lactobacillales bacterium]|jgi:hypothetical protein|nr:hypothetical protein [Lactobacillales bacterium]